MSLIFVTRIPELSDMYQGFPILDSAKVRDGKQGAATFAF